ncbi:DMT family transporter [Albidovulum sediminicola]|uniref:DMT family transporter n=1 Tax=Albidovulum sediminicola TaxID=2984331 RepID=A0ABT2Z3S3_9RHOB|nr:DMT family transporter [Defluviimonas sp. WL0075]MCV2865799.1 DMT family transporter [Defluviimonas sp. WL0075]
MSLGAAPVESPAAATFWRAAPYIFLLFWSGGYTFAKMGLDHIEPLTMLALRYGLAVVALAPFLMRRGIRWPGSARHWGAVALTGFLIQCIYFGLAYLAMKRGMNAGTTAIIMALQPILVAALSPLITGGRPGGRVLWLGLVLGFAGVVLVIVSERSLGPSPWVAVVLALSALLGITLATLFEKWHGMKTDPAVGGVVQYVVGFAVLMPAAMATETMVIDWGPELVIALAYLVIANSIISVGLFIALLQRGDATRISALLYLVPPLAMAVAWVILGETVTLLAGVGFLLSAAGVYLVNRQTGRGT